MFEKIRDRYQILEILGEGGSGKTYRAQDLETDRQVAVKILVLRNAPDWKTIELFEREAKILAQLDHPGIPRYLDFFRDTVAGEDVFCLIQEIAPGRTLTNWIESEPVFTERETKRIAKEVLKILTYLQSFTPPIIHRDIKPQNLLCTESGQVYLVDFGAVRDTYHLTITGGSTIVGTYGYMAPEQFRGQAVLATDLYGLATTVLYLLTGQDPADLPMEQMKINFRSSSAKKSSQLDLSNDFANWLDGMLQPIPEDRFASATKALDYLDDNTEVVIKVPRPKQLISQLKQQKDTLTIMIPPIWLATRSSKKTSATIVSLGLIAGLCFWLLAAANLPAFIAFLCLTVGGLTTPLVCGLGWQYLRSVSSQQEININHREVVIIYKRLGIKKSLQVADIHRMGRADCQKISPIGFGNGIKININDSVDFSSSTITFGAYLEHAEQRWLSHEINQHIQELKAKKRR
jgi:eukaryotic-like serine/threonine-protein kinase